MCHLYNGFDEGNISLKTWGDARGTDNINLYQPGTENLENT